MFAGACPHSFITSGGGTRTILEAGAVPVSAELLASQTPIDMGEKQRVEIAVVGDVHSWL